jgi:hypothetical protein
MAATDTQGTYTLLEMAKRTHDNDHIQIVNTIAEENPILAHAPFVEANNVFSHIFTKVLAMPSGSWRAINDGVALEAGQTTQQSETLAMLESRSEIDKVLIDAAPNPKAARMDEARLFLQGLAETIATGIFYGNADTDPKKFTGLAPRLNSLTPNNVIGASGTGSDLTSIYVVMWDRSLVHMLYPKGHSRQGVEHQDLGVESVSGTTGKFRAYVDMFTAKMGLCVKHDYMIGRIANIETSGTSNIFDEDDLITLLNRMPKQGKGAKIYCNSTIKTQMDIALKDKSNVNFSTDNGLGGVDVLRFKGREVVVCDAIVDTEDAIT